MRRFATILTIQRGGLLDLTSHLARSFGYFQIFVECILVFQIHVVIRAANLNIRRAKLRFQVKSWCHRT